MNLKTMKTLSPGIKLVTITTLQFTQKAGHMPTGELHKK